MRKNLKPGFTLIELLIVIVIIGILAGAVLAIMNPAVQQRKAHESVLRSNTDKVCLAMHSCAASRSDAATNNVCYPIGAVPLGVNNPSGTPTGSTYAVTYGAIVGDGNTSATTIVVQGSLPAGPGAAVAGQPCIFRCTYDTGNGRAVAIYPAVAANCQIQ